MYKSFRFLAVLAILGGCGGSDSPKTEQNDPIVHPTVAPTVAPTVVPPPEEYSCTISAEVADGSCFVDRNVSDISDELSCKALAGSLQQDPSTTFTVGDVCEGKYKYKCFVS